MKHKKEKISCIIAAYNEEKRIGNVLKAVENHPLIEEVIAIDDCSTDRTKNVIKKFKKVKLISFKKNKGKSFAVMKGIEASKNDILLFLDADLKNLTKGNVTQLILPVTKGIADVSISLRSNSLLIYRIIGLDHVSGERVYRKKLIKDYKKFAKLHGYGLESFLNEKIINKKFRIKVVRWDNVIHTMKASKMGFFKGNIEEAKMVIKIIKMMGVYGLLRQVIKMLLLKV